MLFYDLIVAGGGTAGTLCAIAAARSNLRVAIIERSSCLGGMATACGLTEMNAASFQGKEIYRGIEKEIFDELIACGCGEFYHAVPMSSNKDVKVDRLRYDPERLKLILEEKALAAKVQLYYESEIRQASETEESCLVRVQSRYQEFELGCSYLADATGNADVIRLMGGRTEKTPGEKQLTSTVMFRLSNVDMDQLAAYLDSGELPGLIRRGFDTGVLKGRILAFTPIPGSKDVSLNVTRTGGDYEDVRTYSAGMAEARSQILPVVDFVREHVPGLAECYISNISPILGVRDGRRIEGEYRLRLSDLDEMRCFEDRIACGCYPMDIHDPVTKAVIWKVLPGVYYVPYRSLVPQGLSRTLAVGKCICAEKKAFAAIRVMPIMMNVGESAGYLFALAAAGGAPVNTLEACEIRNCLDEKYEEEPEK